MVATYLICRRLEGDSDRSFVEVLEGDSYVPHFICRRLEGDRYVPHLSKDLRVIATFLICRRLEVIATFLICRRLEGDSYVHLSKTL